MSIPKTSLQRCFSQATQNKKTCDCFSEHSFCVFYAQTNLNFTLNFQYLQFVQRQHLEVTKPLFYSTIILVVITLEGDVFLSLGVNPFPL